MRFNRSLFTVLSILILVLGLPLFVPHAFAAEFRAEDSIKIAQNQTVDGNLYAAGSSITVEGNIQGDLICAGQHVYVAGTVSGDILCAGQNITIEGDVEGNVRILAQQLTITGTVARNLTVFGQSVEIRDALIEGEVLAAGQNGDISGYIGKGLVGSFGTLSLDASVDGDVSVETESFYAGEQTDIAGNLDYTSSKEFSPAEGATIAGQIKRIFRETPKTDNRPDQSKVLLPENPLRSANRFSFLLIYLGLGLLWILLFPKIAKTITLRMETQGGKSLLAGFVCLALFPVFLIILLLSIIGIILIPLAVVLFVIGLFIGRISVAVLIGKLLLSGFKSDIGDNQLVQTALGIIVTWFIFGLPIIGLLVTFLGEFWGFGAFIETILSKSPKTLKK